MLLRSQLHKIHSCYAKTCLGGSGIRCKVGLEWFSTGKHWPYPNAFKVSAANFCTGCGYYYGTGINDNFDIRYFDHLDNPNSEHCLGGYTLLHIYEIHHLLECRNCNISKCGKFSHYQYTFTWYGHNDKIKLEDWQIKELGLPLDGTVKVTL